MLQTLAFPAGGRQINAKGVFFRYESSGTPGIDQAIKLRADGQDLGTYVPGDSIELATPAAQWEVVPLVATCVGVVRVGMGRITSSRVAGVVSVVDGNREKVAGGVCFSVVDEVPGAGGGPRAQIWNPAGSGRLVYVTAMLIGSNAADSWNIRASTNALASAGNFVPTNHDSAGAAALALARIDGTGAALTAPRAIRQGYISANADRLIEFPRPVLLRPGNGASVGLINAANILRSSIEFEEWPI